MVTRSDFITRSPKLAAEGRSDLLSVGWLSRMPADFADALLAHAIWRTASADTEFIHSGDTEEGLFAIALSGLTDLTRQDSTARAAAVLLGFGGCRFKEEGLVKTAYRRITILDPDRMRALLND